MHVHCFRTLLHYHTSCKYFYLIFLKISHFSESSDKIEPILLDTNLINLYKLHIYARSLLPPLTTNKCIIKDTMSISLL